MSVDLGDLDLELCRGIPSNTREAHRGLERWLIVALSPGFGVGCYLGELETLNHAILNAESRIKISQVQDPCSRFSTYMIDDTAIRSPNR